MKRIITFVLLVALVVSSFLISGCLPPNFTKEKAKTIAKEHYQEAVVWFQQNKSEAKVDSSCEAYDTGIDLLSAVKGEYKHKGKTYKYVYDYAGKKMYVSEGYEQVCNLVKQALLKEFGYAEEQTEISFHGYSFAANNENDAPRDGGPGIAPKPTDKLSSYQEKLIPANLTVEAFAQEVLRADTKEKFPVYIHIWNKDFVSYEPQKLQAHGNLESIWCSVPIDCEKGFNGVYQKIYFKNKVLNRFCHLEKIQDGVYGGYTSSKPIAEDKVIVTKKNNKSFRLELPLGTKPIFFTKSPKTIVHEFKNTKRDLIQNVAGDVYRTACPGHKGYYNFSDIMVKDNVANCYESITVSLVQGKYDYRILGFFDLDYWMIKFFD